MLTPSAVGPLSGDEPLSGALQRAVDGGSSGRAQSFGYEQRRIGEVDSPEPLIRPIGALPRAQEIAGAPNRPAVRAEPRERLHRRRGALDIGQLRHALPVHFRRIDSFEKPPAAPPFVCAETAVGVLAREDE